MLYLPHEASRLHVEPPERAFDGSSGLLAVIDEFARDGIEAANDA